MMQRVIGAALLLASFTPMAMPTDIDGGFGIRLGEKIDTQALQRKPGSADENEYAFTPEHPYEALTEYSVLVSPDGTVYRILASGAFKSGDACREELGRLERALAEKYGPPNPDRRADVAGISRINFGEDPRKVVAICNGIFGRYKLKLSYSDESLEDSAEKSEAPPETTERDTSGL